MNKYLVFCVCLLSPSIAFSQDQERYIVDVNAFIVNGNTEDLKPINVSPGKWNKVSADNVACSVAAFSFGIVAQCNLPTGMDASVAKCNNTIPDNTDTDDSMQVSAHTKILLKCKTSHDPVKG